MSEDTKKHYILAKDEGSMANVQIINPFNGAITMVGSVTFGMLHILKDTEGLTDTDIPIPKAWHVNISASTAEQILQLAMKIKKPVRKTQKKKKQVNALDILLGRVKV